VVAHENVAKNLDGKLHRLAGGNLDTNHNGKLDKDEASGGYMTVVYFPAERAVLAVDFIFPGTTPPVWGAYDWTPLREWIASIKTVEALDFDTLIAGHGARLGTRADVGANREFLEDLSAAVSKGIAEGKSLDEIKPTVKLEKYSMWPNLSTSLPNVIEQAYQNLRDYP
jgi:glyoxylase-like metal-dependent hydrolase (beta-lactamase superfamily II)